MQNSKSAARISPSNSWVRSLRQQLLTPFVLAISLILVVIYAFSSDGQVNAPGVESNNFIASFFIVLGIGVLLFLYFYFLLGKLGERIAYSENALRQNDAHDDVTGLYNHRAFFTHLERELNRRNRYNQPLSLVMIDIDQFTELNQRYGLEVGNLVLNDLAGLLKEEGRNVDFICRYKGEKYAMILPQTPLDGAFIIAERLRKLIETKGMAPNDSQVISITVSVGVAASPEHGTSVFELISAADEALAKAKALGRNKVHCFQPGESVSSVLE